MDIFLLEALVDSIAKENGREVPNANDQIEARNQALAVCDIQGTKAYYTGVIYEIPSSMVMAFTQHHSCSGQSCLLFVVVWGLCLSLVCHIMLLLCLIQEGLHAYVITMMPSQQQELEQFHNQPTMNDDEDAITTRTKQKTLQQSTSHE